MNSTLLVWIVSALYTGQFIWLSFERNWPGAVVFLGFTVANLGIIWQLKGGHG